AGQPVLQSSGPRDAVSVREPPLSDRSMTMTEDDEALSPEEMLALADDQKRSVQGQTASFVPALMLVWGVVWLLGFGSLWLVDGVESAFSFPMALAVCAGLLAIAIVVSAILSIR